MTVENPSCDFILVIDTDQYSGNFERQLTGFCTGHHDGSHGYLEAAFYSDIYGDTYWRDIIVPQKDDSTGFPRICSIWPTPGRLNNGMGFNYDDGDVIAAEDARLRAIQSMKDYNAARVAMCERRIAENDFEEGERGWTKEACERTIESAKLSVERAGIKNNFPAYESVAIFLSRKPTDEEMRVFTERLYDYANDMIIFGKRSGETLKIKSVHLLDRHRQQVEKYV